MKATKKILTRFSLVILTIIIGSLSTYAQDLTGIWLTARGEARVQIYKLNNGSYAGKLIWTKDKSAKAKKLIGAMILTEFKKESEAIFKGTVHDPEKNKAYNCTATLVNTDDLDLRGYIGLPIFGRTERWTRVTK